MECDWELFEGIPVSTSLAPMINHQMIAAEISREIGNQLDDCPMRINFKKVFAHFNNNYDISFL